MLDKIIYLDHAATTPAYKEVIEAMIPYFSVQFGNPSSSTHPFGWLAKEAIEKTRKQVSELIGASPHEIFFTSGATEAINWVHQSWSHLNGSASIFITQPTEHKAVLETCQFIADSGATVKYVSVEGNGVIKRNELEALVKHHPHAFVSVMHANNETGVKQPLDYITSLKQQFDFVFFCDATQSIGKEEIDVKKLRCDLLAFSAHKMGGPKGCGVLYISETLQQKGLKSLIHGGSQEFGLRAGTQNVPAIVGLGKAIENVHQFNAEKIRRLRDLLEELLQQAFGAIVNGLSVERAAHISSVQIPGVLADKLMMRINHQLAVSTGSACNSSSSSPSHVLTAMGLSNESISATLRFSLGANTTESEIIRAVEIIKVALKNN